VRNCFPFSTWSTGALPADKIASLSSVLAVKIAIIIRVLWWGLFSIPILRNVHQEHYVETPRTKLIKTTFVSIGMTIRHIFHDKALLMFILAYFFYIDGVNSVIHMATAYGSSLGLNSTGMILALMVTQLVAVPCAIWFSKFAEKIGSINMISIAIGVYFIICILGFVMGFGLEEKFLTVAQAQMIFWMLAVLVGTCRAESRPCPGRFFGKLVPRTGPTNFSDLRHLRQVRSGYRAGPLCHCHDRDETVFVRDPEHHPPVRGRRRFHHDLPRHAENRRNPCGSIRLRCERGERNHGVLTS